MTAGALARLRRPGWLVALALFGPACGEGLPDIPLKLSKNCNELEVVTLVPRVGDAADEEVIDVAADGTLGQTAWVLVRRATATGDTEVVVQRVSAGGVEHETVLPVEATASLALTPAPESGRVWVVRDEPGTFELWRVAPEDESRPLLGSTDLSPFPSVGPPCLSCGLDWPRRLFFLPTGAALVALPRESLDASLVVWVAPLETTGAQIWYASEHRLNFEPPCDDSTPESQAFCEEQRMSLSYPEITLLGIQQDPRQTTTMLFGHRTRRQSYDGDPFPIDSADVFMVALQLDADGVPAGVLRSYSGFYTGEGAGGLEGGPAPMPTPDPPYGVAIDRFAAYGLFSNGGQLPRIVQLPESDPEFVELTARVPLTLDTSLVQLDQDVALGRLVDGAWELTKLFPDDPSQSTVQLYETDGAIEQVISGGVGTLMLRKQGAPPEVVRLRCPEPASESDDE